MCLVLRCSLWQWEQIQRHYSQNVLFILPINCLPSSVDLSTTDFSVVKPDSDIIPLTDIQPLPHVEGTNKQKWLENVSKL